MNGNGFHQYVERGTGRVVTERLIADRWVRWLYSDARERMPALFKAATGARFSHLLGMVQYDNPMLRHPPRVQRIARNLGIDMAECVSPANALASPRHLFERQIRYWDTRPMAAAAGDVVSPADAKVLVGSFSNTSGLFLKGKLFDIGELLARRRWRTVFAGGAFAVCRLTPEKYHYNHAPVAGQVLDTYTVSGAFHSCNPGAVVVEATPYSKNRRCVTVFDTDVPGGTGVGRVAMIEVVALMIGDVVQCYSDVRYDAPRALTPGATVRKGQPKSLYRPGSSVDVVIFESDRVRFSDDILANLHRRDVASRFSRNFGQPLVETDVPVRSPIARGR